MTHKLKQALELERKVANLFFNIGAKLSNQTISMTAMRDNDFQKIRGREQNNIHLFLELPDRTYFHLKGDVKHMLFFPKMVEQGKVFVTGYLKKSPALHEGSHSFRNDWYVCDAAILSAQITSQNPDLFPKKQ